MVADGAVVYLRPRSYRLGPASTARDAGLEAGVTVEIDSQPRPQGQGYDIGADEAPPTGAAG